MAARYLCGALKRFAISHPLRCFMLKQHQLLEQPKLLARCVTVAKVNLLHTKVFDKETTWNTERESKKHNYFDPSETVVTTQTDTKPFYETKSTERSDNITINQDCDVFGDTHFGGHEDAGDLAEEEYVSNPPARSQKLRSIDYARMIKDHLRAKQLQEAIDVVEKRMKADRVKPETYTYNLLISACAKAGYTRKAFSLFTKMRQRGIRVTGGTYTSLFNACANAPSAADALTRANHVRQIMLEKGVVPNIQNFNAMIKAYGRWGDVKTAYELADEIREKKLPMISATYNFLLQACASDAQFGFRHCLLTWHKMLQQGIKPDYYAFNTVLRCVRDCGFGDLKTMEEVLRQILDDGQAVQLKINDGTALLIGDGSNGDPMPTESAVISDKTREQNPFRLDAADSEREIQLLPKDMIVQDNLEKPDQSFEIPNLLSVRPHLGSMLTISEVTRPHERFLLLGGITGFLDLMKQNNITPDIVTFTMMLEVIPPTNSAEKQVLTFIRRIGLKADVDFFNVLIKKRSMRFDYEGAKEVLSMIRTAGLHPDIVTYGVLALGCQTQEAARELLEEMQTKGIRMNIQILGAMLRQGCAQKAFPYVNEIMQISLDERIKPNDVFLRHLHNFHKQCARAIDSRHPSTKKTSFKKQHAKFCDKLRLYYEEQGIAGLKLEDAIKTIKERPYQQYKENKIDGIEPLKNEVLAKKQKIRKYIKKIKIASLRGDEPSNNRSMTAAAATQQKALD